MNDAILELIKKDCENLICEKIKEGKFYIDDTNFPNFDNKTKAFLGNKYDMMAICLFLIWCDEINILEKEGILIRSNNKYIHNAIK